MLRAAIALAAALGQPVGQPPASEWKPYAPAGAGFSVRVPSAMKETRSSLKTAQGAVEIRTHLLATKDGAYVVVVTEYPAPAVREGEEDARLDQARDGAVRQSKGRLRSEKKASVDGLAGRELFVATEVGKAVRMRLAAERNRLYQVMAVGDTRFLESMEVGRFLDSFQRTK